MTLSLRAALYWTPRVDDALFQAGNAWLGRDPEHGVELQQPKAPGIAEATEAARLYGFHATLRPPMRLATGWQPFIDSAKTMAAAITPFQLPPLAVDERSGFLVLRAAEACRALHDLADACVRATDPHRLAASPEELAIRRRAGLSAAEDMLLLRWGYPYVMQRWQFHMTLSRRLAPAEMAVLRRAAEAHFAAALAIPRRVTGIAVFTQRIDDPPASFLIAERIRLG